MEYQSPLHKNSAEEATFEVELKFPIDNKAALTERLQQLGAKFGETVRQSDCYFQHPCRDLAETDEALRIRSTGDSTCVTYKGPRLAGNAKTRRELEFPLENGAAFASLLELLGFQAVATVEKQRRIAVVVQNGRALELALDEVEMVGSFLEIETLAAANDLKAASACVGDLAEQLGLNRAERRSYLGLLLEQLKGEGSLKRL